MPLVFFLNFTWKMLCARTLVRPSVARRYSTAEDLKRDFARGRLDESTFRRKMKEMEMGKESFIVTHWKQRKNHNKLGTVRC